MANLEPPKALHTDIRREIPHHAIRDEQRAQVRIRPRTQIKLRKIEIRIEITLREADHVRRMGLLTWPTWVPALHARLRRCLRMLQLGL